MQPDRKEGTPEKLDAKAREQFDEARELYFPGFAFSELPANFELPVKDGWTVTASVGNRWRNKDRWNEIPVYLSEHPVGKVPQGWKYAKLVGNAEPHRFDLKNPRLYTLEGRLVPMAGSFPSAGMAYTHRDGHFTTMLLDVFRTADREAPNMRTAEVHAFLEHHRTKGGNPERLAEFVEELLAGWKAAPLADLPHAKVLYNAVERWLAEAHKAPTSAKTARNADPKHMETKEIDTRFRELSTILLNVWDGNALYRLGEKLREAYEVADDYEGGNLLEPHTKLDDHLGKCSTAAIAEIDASLASVPCSEYSRLKFSSLLSGEPTPWGATFDLTSRAKTFTDNLKFLVRNSDYEDSVAADIEYREGEAARLLFQGRMLKAEAERWENVRGGLMLHVLRVFQHLVDAGMKWGTGNPHTSAIPTPNSKRPDLKLLALVHALRWIATKDKDADISKDNAQALAEAAGSKGKQAGKDLFDRYTLYTLKANSKAERMQDGQPHTVKKRYLVAITMLEDHTKAKDMAERELEELHADKVDTGK
jgi:hypothetical protein